MDDVRVPKFFNDSFWHGHLCRTRLAARQIASQTAVPTSAVVAGLPAGFRSAVTRPLSRTVSIADSTAAASSFRLKLYASIAPIDPIVPRGFAMPLPAISGAEP